MVTTCLSCSRATGSKRLSSSHHRNRAWLGPWSAIFRTPKISCRAYVRRSKCNTCRLLILGLLWARDRRVYFSSDLTTIACDPGAKINLAAHKKASCQGWILRKGYSAIHAEFLVVASSEHWQLFNLLAIWPLACHEPRPSQDARGNRQMAQCSAAH